MECKSTQNINKTGALYTLLKNFGENSMKSLPEQKNHKEARCFSKLVLSLVQ